MNKRKALSILEKLTTHLPDIKQALGSRWPAFVSQMGAQAASFENLADEEPLAKMANQLMGLFMLDETAREIITRPYAEVIRRPQPKAHEEIPLQTLANRFYLLCQRPDEFIAQGDQFFEQAAPGRAANQARPAPEKDSGLRKEQLA